MNKEVKALWIETLLSGDYEQGKGYLNSKGKFCCLGVLCEIAVAQGVIAPGERLIEGYDSIDRVHYGHFGGSTTTPPGEVVDWADLPDWYGTYNYDDDGHRASSLAEDNDNGKSFAEIAEIIREYF